MKMHVSTPYLERFHISAIQIIYYNIVNVNTVPRLLDRKHMTKFEQILSSVLSINASIIQGSVIGPTAYVINASDLKANDPSNYLDKYADDTYFIVPASNSCTIPAELDNVSAWATANNLSLNVTKSCEMIVRRPRMAVNDPACSPRVETCE